MLDRTHLERVLKINGVSPTAADEEIRAVLLSARYRDDEVNMALLVLRENVETKTTRVDSLHKLIRTDQLLTAKEISTLLGIEVSVPTMGRRKEQPEATSGAAGQRLAIAVLSVVLALIGLGLAMYIQEFGVFHASAAIMPYEW
jgi:hypothetical protein